MIAGIRVGYLCCQAVEKDQNVILAKLYTNLVALDMGKDICFSSCILLVIAWFVKAYNGDFTTKPEFYMRLWDSWKCLVHKKSIAEMDLEHYKIYDDINTIVDWGIMMKSFTGVTLDYYFFSFFCYFRTWNPEKCDMYKEQNFSRGGSWTFWVLLRMDGTTDSCCLHAHHKHPAA